MEQLPYDLCFCHRFNLYKPAGMLIEDDDIGAIARIFGVPEARLQECEDRVRKIAADAARALGDKKKYTAADTGCRYVALGDSITSDRTSYTNIIQNLWRGTGGREVIDAGISGDTVANLIDRFYSDVLNVDFDWVSIFIGTNDSRGLNDKYSIHRTSIEGYKKALNYFIQRLLDTTGNIILITIPPVDNERMAAFFGTASNWIYQETHIKKINDIIRKAAKKNRVRLADLAGEIETSGIDPLDVDGLHMNTEGQQLLTGLLLDILP